MRRKDLKISHNGIDIAQRFMAKKMVGQVPLKALSYETARVQDVLPTDLPIISTGNEQADTLYLLEDGTFLHVEYQTTVKKHDSFRFAGYVLSLYNMYKDDKRISTFNFKTVVLYAPHIKRKSVNPSFDIGAIQYRYTPIFLNEVHQQESYIEIIDKIRANPNVKLTEEEKMIILYRPLFNQNIEEIERDAMLVVKDIQEMAEESERANLTGTIFVLVRKYLSESGQTRIWEVLKQMNVVKEEMEQQFIQWQQKEVKDELIEAIRDGESKKSIERLIKIGKFSKEEMEEIYKEAEKR